MDIETAFLGGAVLAFAAFAAMILWASAKSAT